MLPGSYRLRKIRNYKDENRIGDASNWMVVVEVNRDNRTVVMSKKNWGAVPTHAVLIGAG